MTDFFHSRFVRASRFHWDFLRDLRELEYWNCLANAYAAWLNRDVQEEANHQIPKIIHQIWLGPKPLPELYKRWGESWQRFNPEFEYRLWLDADVERFGLENKSLFCATRSYGAKSDIARYEILYRLGGIYVDTDFECVAPIPSSLLSFSFVGCLQFDAAPQLGNSVILAAPQNALLASVIKSCVLPAEPGDMFSVLHATGPFLLTRKYFEANAVTRDASLVLPSNYFFPWPNFAMDFKGNPHSFITEESIGIHHWQTSWFEKPRQGVRYHLKGLVKAFVNAPQCWFKYFKSLRDA